MEELWHIGEREVRKMAQVSRLGEGRVWKRKRKPRRKNWVRVGM